MACLLRELLAEDGLEPFPKTSGKKGLHLYVPVTGASDARTSAYAKAAAERLERDHGDLVISRMNRRLRDGKVFVDWSQNNARKTTVAPYSLRAADLPAVSTPVTWSEVEACQKPTALRFCADDVRARIDDHGDLLEGLLSSHKNIP